MKTTLPKDIDEILMLLVHKPQGVEGYTKEALRNSKQEILKTHIPKSELLKLIKESKPEHRHISYQFEHRPHVIHNKAIDLFEQNLLNKLEEK